MLFNLPNTQVPVRHFLYLKLHFQNENPFHIERHTGGWLNCITLIFNILNFHGMAFAKVGVN